MRSATLAAVLALAVAAVAPSAGADSEATTVITDAAGDANFVNGNGLSSLAPTDGVDTRPASIAGADLRSVDFSTPYDTIKVYNQDGTVSQVLYSPKAFRVRLQMEGDVMPTFGPTIIVRILTNIAGCDVWFQAIIRGSNPDAAADPHRADIRLPAAASCPGNAAVLSIANGFTLDVSGKTVTMTYPFEAFTGNHAGWIKPGTQIDPDGSFLNNANTPHVRPWLTSLGVTVPSIDETARPQAFVVGSDVPQTLVCSQQPAHPDCQP
ncbi:MAG TPA: hypothetical protein VM638_05625 [Actinomycetota bacterium]|nr:hypothetical protein [Actinomycetota bacterium]